MAIGFSPKSVPVERLRHAFLGRSRRFVAILRKEWCFWHAMWPDEASSMHLIGERLDSQLLALDHLVTRVSS